MSLTPRPDAPDTDDADRGVVSGRPPSMLLGFTVFSSVVATAALVVGAVTRSPRPTIWILAAWATVVLVCSYRALAMHLRHPRAFAALRTARRQLPAGAYELRSMAADTPEALEDLVRQTCAQADAIDRTLFIEVEDGDEMIERWTGLGFATTATVDTPWGPIHLIVRPPSSHNPNGSSTR